MAGGSPPATAALLQRATFSPPTAGNDTSLLLPDGSSATPYGAIGEGSVEGSRVWRSQPVTLKSSRFSSPYPEPPRELTRWESTAPYICEFVGTFLLVFTAASCSYTGDKGWTPTAVGCALVVIVYSVGYVSGGHLNPAVTLSVFLAKKITAFKAACYVVVQVFAGLLAGCFFEVVFLTHSSWVKPVAPFHFAQAAVFEVLYTAMLCFVWLNVSSAVRNNPENDKNQFFALAIGFVVIAAGYAGGNISGAVLNPSLALGLDLAGWWRGAGVQWGFLYALVELCGGILAALLFRICRPEDYMDTRHSYDGHHIDDITSYVPSSSVRLFSEFVGTFFLVLTFGLNVIMMSAATAWSVSAALLSMVYALANVSGGHFNPAVTAAVVLSGRGKCSRQDGYLYVLVQLLGGIAASALVSYMHQHGPTAAVQFGLLGATGVYHWSAVATVEIFFTFMLTYVVLAVATSDEYTVSSTRSRQNFYFALAIGFAMCAGNFASAPVSGGYLNPAVALSFAVEGMPNFVAEAHVKGWPGFSDDILQVISIVCKFVRYFGYFLLYFLFELIGAAMAACVFRLTHPAEYHEKLPNYVTYVEHTTREQ